MKCQTLVAVLLLCLTQLVQSQVSGELKQWHKVTLTFQGPETSENTEPNPFLDYRLQVEFKHQATGTTYSVPGYYAADGNAANSSAGRGNQWRVHFSPDALGEWTYRVSFCTGENIAVDDDKDAGSSAGFMDGETGTLMISASDKTGRDFRAKGRLQYAGERYLKFSGNGEYFLKAGADAPENLLAYADFDGDFKSDGHKDDLIKTWESHVRDWQPGDPTWQGDKGKGLIGALNYLASRGMNAFSFLPMNIEGDDRNVFPYTEYGERYRMDVSRLDQWEIVFEHGQKLGLFLHFKTQEAENQKLLDGGDVGVQRKLYYRELIARFGHHLALNWNLGEENGTWGDNVKGQSTEQRLAMAQYFYDNDPYHHHIVIHNGQWFDDLYGPESKLTGASLQTHRPDFSLVHPLTLQVLQESEKAGKIWAVACDEPGDATHALLPDADNPNHNNARQNALWGNLLAGGWGVEWYFGYAHAHSDLTCQDWRSRDNMWDQSGFALKFFNNYPISFWTMSANDSLSHSNDWVLASEWDAEPYWAVIYSKDGGECVFDIPDGSYDYGWFNPHTGNGLNGLLHSGTIEGAKQIKLNAPDSRDWVLLIGPQDELEPLVNIDWEEPLPKRDTSYFTFDFNPQEATQVYEEKDGLLVVEAEHYSKQSCDDVRKWYLVTESDLPDIQPDPDGSHAGGASGGAYLEILPDTRTNHSETLIQQVNFTEDPGRIAVLYYAVYFNTPGTYYVWVRACPTGSEDNGLHVGIDGEWPVTGYRMQWISQDSQWHWDSKQRTPQVHTGVPYRITLEVEESGLHTIMFSMREDGFEMDKWLMSTDKDVLKHGNLGLGPEESLKREF